MTLRWPALPRLLPLLFALALLAGCATPRRSEAPPGVQVWTGRMALTVQDSQAQSFSAGFELKGNPEGGELTLFNPLGGTAGVAAWSPGSATMRSGGQVRQYPSLDALVTEVAGSPIPVAALFDWLAGRPAEVPGWHVDLSQVAEGRLRAQRSTPPPLADLRIVFER